VAVPHPGDLRCLHSALPRWDRRLLAVGQENGTRARRLIAIHEKPKTISSDDGTELTSIAILAWTDQIGVECHYIAPGKPVQNAFIESFDGRRATTA
jgi:transposase InsO family protein